MQKNQPASRSKKLYHVTEMNRIKMSSQESHGFKKKFCSPEIRDDSGNKAQTSQKSRGTRRSSCDQEMRQDSGDEAQNSQKSKGTKTSSHYPEMRYDSHKSNEAQNSQLIQESKRSSRR